VKGRRSHHGEARSRIPGEATPLWHPSRWLLGAGATWRLWVGDELPTPRRSLRCLPIHFIDESEARVPIWKKGSNTATGDSGMGQNANAARRPAAHFGGAHADSHAAASTRPRIDGWSIERGALSRSAVDSGEPKVVCNPIIPGRVAAQRDRRDGARAALGAGPGSITCWNWAASGSSRMQYLDGGRAGLLRVGRGRRVGCQQRTIRQTISTHCPSSGEHKVGTGPPRAITASISSVRWKTSNGCEGLGPTNALTLNSRAHEHPVV